MFNVPLQQLMPVENELPKPLEVQSTYYAFCKLKLLFVN